MDSRKNELDEFDGWVQVCDDKNASDEQQKMETIQSEKNLLKKDREEHLQETVNVLKSVELAKLNAEKSQTHLDNTQKELENVRQKLESTTSQNLRLKKQIRKLNKRLHQQKKQKSKNETAKSLLRLVATTLLKEVENFECMLSSHNRTIHEKKELEETRIHLKEATTWANHFEKMTIKCHAELLQRNSEIHKLQKQNAVQKTPIDNSTGAKMRLFSPKTLEIKPEIDLKNIPKLS